MIRNTIRYFLFYSIFLILSSRGLLFGGEPEAGSKRIIFINNAFKYLGAPYRYGGETEKGMDCSGLVCRCAADVLEMQLPRRSDSLAEYAVKIDENEVQPGDLLFFNTTGRISHTGIYIGAGKFIHAASDGPKTGVIISELAEAYWKNAYRQAGRIMPAESVFTGEAALPLFRRTERNSVIHPDIRLETAVDSSAVSAHTERTAAERDAAVSGTAVPSAGKHLILPQRYGFRAALSYGVLWDWNRHEDFFRGIVWHTELAWANRWVSPGVGAGICWDHRTGSVSAPVIFYLELFEYLRLYTGYQHHFFVHTSFDKKPFFPNIVGIALHSPPLRAGMQIIRLFQAVEYSYIRNTPVEKRFRLFTGISFNFYKETSQS